MSKNGFMRDSAYVVLIVLAVAILAFAIDSVILVRTGRHHETKTTSSDGR